MQWRILVLKISLKHLKISMYKNKFRHLCFSALKQVLGNQFLQNSLYITLRFAISYVSWDTMSPSIIILGFLLPLFPSIRLSITSFTRPSHLKMCPIPRFLLSNAVFKSFLFSFTRSNTYSLVFNSFHITSFYIPSIRFLHS